MILILSILGATAVIGSVMYMVGLFLPPATPEEFTEESPTQPYCKPGCVCARRH